MAETLEGDHDASFWLPTHFLTDDDFLTGDHRKLNKDPTTFDLFSNGFDPFAGSHSALDSPVSSTESEPEKKNNNNHDDDEFLAELTRQLAQSALLETRYNSNPIHSTTTEKPWVFSTSPQSTLTGFGPWSNRSGFTSNGSPNGPSRVPSPPVSPPGAKKDAAWELLYEAAGQVARLKMNAIATAAQINQNRALHPSLSSKSHHANGFYDFPNTNQFQAVKRQGSTMWAQGKQQERENWHCPHHHHLPRRTSAGGALGLPQSAWPPLGGSVHHRQNGGAPPEAGMRAMFLGGSGLDRDAGPGLKRQSAGTGVFLPRRPGTQQQPAAEPRRKPTGGSPVLIPARVVQALNLNLDEIDTGANPNSQPRFGRGFVSDHEIMMARRNSFLEQQRSLRRNGASAMAGGHEVSLPSDWTY